MGKWIEYYGARGKRKNPKMMEDPWSRLDVRKRCKYVGKVDDCIITIFRLMNQIIGWDNGLQKDKGC